ncbi:MAG: ATP-binding protein [Rudaea sp.]
MTTAQPSSADGGSSQLVGYGREVQVELVSLHARIIQRMPWVQSVLAVGVGIVVLRYVPTVWFALWCVTSIGIETLRARYAMHVLGNMASLDSRRAHAWFVLLAIAAGAAVGIGAACSFPSLPIADQSLLAIVLFALPAGGVAVSQSSRYIAAAYCLAILVPAATSWAVLHPAQAWSVGLLTLIYCVFIIVVAVEGEHLLLRSVIIRHERDRLVRDLEQRNNDVRAAMKVAEESALARARVLATASHDLRQPLHALSIYSAVLATEPAPEQLREVAANIDQIVRSLGSLLHGLLDLSRLTAGHYEPERARVALDSVVSAVAAEYQRAAAEKNLKLRTQLAPIRIVGDAVLIGRIVRNLLDNAIKYTENGTIDVNVAEECGAHGAVAVVRVSDTGPGIPLDQQARVFEEFYQLDNPARDRRKGVGLGLAIVKRLCELIGADVFVESVPNAGATFVVRMTGLIQDDAQTHAATKAEESFPLRGCSVYVVDDEDDILRSTQQLLVSWGVRVAIANSAIAAEDLFCRGGRPDLMMTDLRLRGAENGAQLAQRLRREFSTFPVLVVTGEVSASAVDQVAALGAPLLYKPITPESLRRAMSKAIGRSAR